MLSAISLVALGPLADVAVESHGGKIAARFQIHRVAVGDEIGERQVAGIGMVHEFAKEHAERSDVGRQQQVGAAGCLATAFERTIVHRPHLVGVVAEIGGRTGVVEREHGADEQRTLMVAHREWSAEGRARLTIGHVTVGKKDAACSREPILEAAGFAHKAVGQLDAAAEVRAATDDGVLADDSGVYDDGILDGAADGAVGQP